MPLRSAQHRDSSRVQAELARSGLEPPYTGCEATTGVVVGRVDTAGALERDRDDRVLADRPVDGDDAAAAAAEEAGALRASCP